MIVFPRTTKRSILALFLVLLLLLNSVAFLIPSVSAVAKISYAASAKAMTPSVEAGSEATIQVSVTPSETTDVLIDVEFYDSDVKNVGKVFVDRIHLEAGVEKTTELVWKVPASLPEGKYTVSFGIFGAGWGSPSKWYPGAATIRVTGGVPSVDYATGATVTPDPVLRGERVAIDASVTASVYTEALVEVSVVQPDGEKALSQSWVETLAAGQKKDFLLHWTVPATAPLGNYKVAVGLYSPDRMVTYKENAEAARFQVASESQPVPATPADVKAVPSTDSVTVTWKAAEQATSYDVEVDGTPVGVPAGALSYTHSGLKPDSEHTYRVRAKNGSLAGPWSAAVTVKLPPAVPESQDIKILTTTGNKQSTSSITPKFKLTNLGKTAIPLKDTKLRYYFTADFAKDEEKPFEIGFYAMVKWRNLSADDVETDIVKMPIPAADATHYLEVGFNEGAGVVQPGETLTFSGWMNKSDWSSFDQTNDFSFLNTSAETESPKTLVYQDGELVWGVEPTLLDIPPFPATVESTSTDTSITLTWDAVADATGYEVRADGVSTTVAGNTFVHDFLKPGTLHTYHIRTINGSKTSLWSSAFTAKTTGEQILPAPAGVRAAKNETSIQITWKALQELVTGYEIEVDGAVLPTGKTLSYTHDGLTPATLHTYRVRARDGETAGPWSDPIKVNTLRTVTGTFDVQFNVDPTADRTPISPYIYGANEDLTGTENLTARRAGGNRFSTYNWENNASNSGSDSGHVSDSFIPWYYGGIPVSDSAKWEVPGSAAVGFHQQSLEKGAYTLWSLPTAGYAAKTKGIKITDADKAPSSSWVEVQAAKGGPFSLTPDLNDNVAYNDEFVNFLVNKFGPASSATGIQGYSIDNEPGLWNKTHKYMHPEMPKGAEVLSKSIDLAKAVKNVDPSAELFGPVSYGFSDMYMVDNKAEWEQIKGKYEWYLDYYLDNMARESRIEGKRLLDVLDVHWYSEERGGGIRITSTNLAAHTLETHKVRVQAPRSLWDPSYLEDTWIGKSFSGFLPWLPTMKNSVNKYNPGTKLAITEYDFGGNNHVSGGIAQADTLGIFGKQGLYLATYWNMAGTANLSKIPYLSSAFKIYNNYDGMNSKYGDTNVRAETNDIENSSIYSSTFKDSDDNLHMIVINKNFDYSMNAAFTIGGTKQYTSAKVWAFDENSPQITERDGLTNINGNKFTLTIPKLTVAHIVLS